MGQSYHVTYVCRLYSLPSRLAHLRIPSICLPEDRRIMTSEFKTIHGSILVALAECVDSILERRNAFISVGVARGAAIWRMDSYYFFRGQLLPSSE